ncbi:SurA N-terminal domain-containing protein [Nitrosomonas halophila]|uniref:Periplasmic chaperone PpiD n=1 Tax=Nitrosomonas halophila TaxID=44576 RepID=A0A1H3FYL2_9PROT|nr:SurA N-terminal domain-containing protein [Nitrosomonas halophila]SDX95925.1 peptidyl-prolyl cis-trans isomerase D [Nitrosomonas halophila]
MFDFVNRRKTIVQIVLLIAVLPFMFWGVQSYRSESDTAYVAVVDGEEISRREYEQALRNQQENLRNMLGEDFDIKLMDDPEMRRAVLENLIQKRILRHEAGNVGLTVLDSRLAAEIQNIAFFQEDGKFSYQRYQDLLQRQGMTPAIFEARLVSEIMEQQLLEGVTRSVVVPEIVARNVLSLSETQYEINRILISPEQYVAQVEPDEAAIQDYYDSHYRDFMLPERVRVEYVVLSLEQLAQQEQVSEQAIQAYFEEHRAEFEQPEERRASHILFTVPADASEEEKAAVKARAEQVLEQVQQEPDQLPELAAELSQDPGSAKMGGDLGFFSRGLMVKAFEDEVFQMELDEIRGLVETPFGFHIVKLTAIREADTADFEDVRDHVEQQLKYQKVAERFGELAEDFSNIVYEQSDTLQLAAEMFNLPIQQSDWLDRKSKEPELIANERMLQAIFSESAIRDRFNTEAVEVKADTIVAARVLEHRPASAQSIELVREQILTRLQTQLAAEIAVKEGSEQLARLQSGEADETIDWGESVKVSYAQMQGVDVETLRLLAQTESSQLPAYTGAPARQGGFDLIRINQVTAPKSEHDASKYDAFLKQLQQVRGQEELMAYLNGLRQRYEVRIREESF